ncbi:MAG: excinuclease ABC subunit A [Chlamydiales bacterium]|jgi:excinuclease ABC subunit A
MKERVIRIRGCRQHNLKDIDLDIPKYKIIVFTGVSGSGKSSLAFDTIYAEGQRRYMESLSPQARSFIRQLPKPDVDLIEGLSPTLAIGQGRGKVNPRGTVIAQTDIHDFLCVLFAKIGEQFSPATDKRLLRQTRQEIVESILREYEEGERLQLIAPVSLEFEELVPAVSRLRQQGFIRLRINGEEFSPEDPVPDVQGDPHLEVVIDRIIMKTEIRSRLNESVVTALELGRGVLKVQEGKEGSQRYFTEIYVCPETGLSFAPLGMADFNYKSIHGACPECHGKGGKEKVQGEEIFLDKDQPLDEQLTNLIEKFPRRKACHYQVLWNAYASKHLLSEDEAYGDGEESLSTEVLYGGDEEFPVAVDLDGNERKLITKWKGLVAMIQEDLEENPGKSRFTSMDFVSWEICPECNGGRLKAESRFCRIEGRGIHDLCVMTVEGALEEISSWKLEDNRAKIAEEILPDIISRLTFLQQVGLGYLELDRQGATLSEGEAQRVQLAAQIGAKLSGVLYVLDEPSTGLHYQDVQYLVKVVEQLRDLDNSVILVEHQKTLISHADMIVELGRGAGVHGGEITFQGSYEEMLKEGASLTGDCLSGKMKMPTKRNGSKLAGKMTVSSVNCHNLKDFSVEIPLNALVGFCGVSGSGKSSLLVDAIATEMRAIMNNTARPTMLQGYQSLKRLIVVEQKQGGISLRSTPATYVGVMTPLRKLFAETKLAKARGYTSTHFSLNKKGGRCDACEGMGQVRVSMPFMADVFVTCEVCQGKRYNFETLQVTWEESSMADVLDMSVEVAFKKFQNIPEIASRLLLMEELGLEYLALGQNFTTLSGGEIQRLKLVSELARKTHETTLYILDEPSSGLHYHDIEKLVKILHRLVEKGHSVLFVEHQLDILRQADWLIELGPGGGPKGGQLIFEGKPAQLKRKSTPTGQALAGKF